VQNLESLSILGAKTGLIGSSVDLTGLSGVQTSPTDTPIGLTGPSVPDSSDLVP
jgi:hypothetical protein